MQDQLEASLGQHFKDSQGPWSKWSIHNLTFKFSRRVMDQRSPSEGLLGYVEGGVEVDTSLRFIQWYIQRKSGFKCTSSWSPDRRVVVLTYLFVRRLPEFLLSHGMLSCQFSEFLLDFEHPTWPRPWEKAEIVFRWRGLGDAFCFESLISCLAQLERDSRGFTAENSCQSLKGTTGAKEIMKPLNSKQMQTTYIYIYSYPY